MGALTGGQDVAKGNRGQVPGIVSGGPKGGPKGKPGKGGRVSVASARKSSGDRTQLIIGAVAIVVIIAVIVVGMVLYSKNSATQGAGYGTSTKSVATVDDSGAITVANGSPALSLDVYEDALCPICGDFEHQYGQQIAQAIDEGQLKVQYRMVDFLNSASHSGDYSSRAYGALLAVAKNEGSKPGVFMSFHTAIYDAKNQPKENSSSDLSNQQLADLAGTVGVSEATQKLIADGAEVSAATKDAQTNMSTLTDAAAKVGRSPGTPTVVKDGIPISTNDVNWLKNLLPADASSGAASSEATTGN
jgi:protein-disulfide isomerase